MKNGINRPRSIRMRTVFHECKKLGLVSFNVGYAEHSLTKYAEIDHSSKQLALLRLSFF